MSNSLWPTDCSMPGFPVLHYLWQFAEIDIQLIVCWELIISPGNVMGPILHFLVYKVQGRRHLYTQQPALSSRYLCIPAILEAHCHPCQVCDCIEALVIYPRKKLAMVLSSSLFCLSSSLTLYPAKLGTYLELVLLVPPVMLLEAKLQPRSSSCPGRDVSRKLLQRSMLKSH